MFFALRSLSQLIAAVSLCGTTSSRVRVFCAIYMATCSPVAADPTAEAPPPRAPAAASTDSGGNPVCEEGGCPEGKGSEYAAPVTAGNPFQRFRSFSHSVWNQAKKANPVWAALAGTSFGWLMTAAGAGFVFVAKIKFMARIYQRFLDFMLGIAGGVMTAASFWSLLAPAIEFAEQDGYGALTCVPVALGFWCGGALLQSMDLVLARFGSMEDTAMFKTLTTNHAGKSQLEKTTKFRQLLLLVGAITLHNFPEGMAVGVAFGAAGAPGLTQEQRDSKFGAAVSLAVGIGIQNYPEGLAVSMPLMREGLPAWKAFLCGQASAVVEPIGGVLGALFVQVCRPALPFTMSLAAGAMIFVVADSLVIEMQANGNRHLAMQGLMLGFVIMMCLDVGLG